MRGHDGAVNCLAVTTSRVYSGSADKSIRVWNIDTGECLHKFIGHRGPISCLEHSDGSIFSGSMDSTIKIWNTKVTIRRLN
jgi:WD40 repeat protein